MTPRSSGPRISERAMPTHEAPERGRHVLVTMDGVRGVAAICVMLGHFVVPLGVNHVLFASSYFAVDIFFCLSGFVICYSYEDRLDHGLSTIDFIKVRLIRLYPMYVLGLALGVCHLFSEYWLGRAKHTAETVILVISFGLLFLPWSGKFENGHDGGQDETALFPLNMPSWSLFFELFVSVSYALFRPRGKILFATLLLSLLLLTLETPPSLPAIQFPRVVVCFYSGAALCRLWRSGALRFSSRKAILAPALAILLCLIPLSG